MKRFDESLRKINMVDWLLHIFGVHLVRTNLSGEQYCRICGKVFNEIPKS